MAEAQTDVARGLYEEGSFRKTVKKYWKPVTAVVSALGIGGAVAYFGITSSQKDHGMTGEELNQALNVPKQTEVEKNAEAVYSGDKKVERTWWPGDPEPVFSKSKIVFEGRNAKKLKEHFGYTEKELKEHFKDYKITIVEFENGRKSYSLSGIIDNTDSWQSIYPKGKIR